MARREFPERSTGLEDRLTDGQVCRILLNGTPTHYVDDEDNVNEDGTRPTRGTDREENAADIRFATMSRTIKFAIGLRTPWSVFDL